MASVLAIVSKAVFEQLPVRSTGQVAGLDRYKTTHAAFDNLTDNDAIFLVTVRDNDVLWLVAVIENPAKSRGVWSGTVNTTPITDITKQLPKLVLASGAGIKRKPGKLGMSLQTPRVLADADVALLRNAAPRGARHKRAEPSVPGSVANHGGPVSVAARKLIEQVFASPDDRALKAVVADALLQEHHVWGELISLQMSDPKKHARRIREIIAEHAGDFVGPIVHLAKREKLEFADGFLVGCAATKTLTKRQWQQAVSVREWSTVKRVELGVYRSTPTWWLAEWLQNPAMANVTTLRIDWIRLERQSPRSPWRIEGKMRGYGDGLVTMFLESIPLAELARIPTPAQRWARELLETVRARRAA